MARESAIEQANTQLQARRDKIKEYQLLMDLEEQGSEEWTNLKNELKTYLKTPAPQVPSTSATQTPPTRTAASPAPTPA